MAPAEGTSVTVSGGRAWLHPSRWAGFSVTAREDTTLTLPQADSYLPRIDRIVLRYDATSRTTTLQVLQGAAGSSPTAPDISRTEMVYDLCLAEVVRPAGQTSLTTADITDTRADAALCGLMRDGVTGIPVNALGAQALAKAKETAALCDALLQSYTGGYLGIWPVTLTTSGWAKSTDLPSYPYKQTAELRAARESSRPEAVPALDSFSTAIAAGIAGVCETKDGTITFWAEEVPEQDILMQVTLLGKMTAENQQEA
nr:MAG TPA: Receptor Binding Protein [Caudoviricetes sp.]